MPASPSLPEHAVHGGKTIDQLDLVSYAEASAKALLSKCPDVILTSGRRDAAHQASAMAGNVVKKRKWIEQTYADTPERAALQQWVNDNPTARTAAAVAAGLLGIMSNWSDAQKSKLSRHFSGQAFDVHPVAGQRGAEIKAAIRALPRLRKFLSSEGGLIIWHADFE